MTTETEIDDGLAAWLLDSDPALRWQVERDLLHAEEDVWRATRARVATEGFGAALLARQDPDGQWAGGAYFPGDFDWESDEASEGQPYTATTWSLNALREWGLDASVLEGTAAKLAESSRWEYENLPYWSGEVDACINAFTLANGAWLGADVTTLRAWFGEHQLAEGGWNCSWVDGSVRSSFHSTLNTIGGLLAYERLVGGDEEVRGWRRRGEEYLLERRLMYRRSTGEQVASWVPRFAYPFRWFYSVLRATDHVRGAAGWDAAAPDPRLAEAVELVRAARQPDGTWQQERRHPGRVWFEVDVPAGEPSRWLTFFALRVLRWWDASAAG